MQKSWNRRQAAVLAMAAVLPVARAEEESQRFAREVRAIERRCGGRLGVFLQDTASGKAHAHRADERFPMCSTFKLLLAGAVLARVDAGHEQLARRIAVTRGDMLDHAPVTGPRVGGEPLTVAELCAAAVTLSDNPAANLLLRAIGGPSALTAWLRGTGDMATRLDRWEPALNAATPGDPRDTTTPRAYGLAVRKIALGEVLSPASRAQFTEWMLGNKVGDARLRKDLPPGWRVGDKTGTGARGTSNDAGLLWPPRGAPVVASVFLTGGSGDGPARDAAIAEVGRLAASLFP